jgi:zinc and cadmium transporter
VIGGAFMVDIRLGLVTWFAVAAHEIPQELGDFGVLVHGGWKKLKALQFNFISGLAVIAGGVAAYFIAFELSLTYLLAFAAGSFIYIASSDLIPEVKHSDKIKDNLVHFFSFASGVLLIWAVKFFE